MKGFRKFLLRPREQMRQFRAAYEECKSWGATMNFCYVKLLILFPRQSQDGVKENEQIWENIFARDCDVIGALAALRTRPIVGLE